MVIAPAVAGVGLLAWDRTDDMIAAGKLAAEKALAEAPAGDAPTVLPQFRVDRVGNVLVVAEPVTNEGRSVERLDALRATAVRAAGGVPPATGGVPALAE